MVILTSKHGGCNVSDEGGNDTKRPHPDELRRILGYSWLWRTQVCSAWTCTALLVGPGAGDGKGTTHIVYEEDACTDKLHQAEVPAVSGLASAL